MSGDFSLPFSISMGKHFREFVKRMVSEGRYQTASEVIRAGLRLLEEEELRWESKAAGKSPDADKDAPGVKEAPPA